MVSSTPWLESSWKQKAPSWPTSLRPWRLEHVKGAGGEGATRGGEGEGGGEGSGGAGGADGEGGMGGRPLQMTTSEGLHLSGAKR